MILPSTGQCGGLMEVEVRVPDSIWPTRSWNGRIVAVHVRPGDCVSKGDVIVEVEVEKAVFEVTSPDAGRVVKVLVAEGDVVSPGSVLALLEAGACP